MSAYTAPPIDVARFRGAQRADLIFAGVDQAGPSFEARVFLNNPRADEGTPRGTQAGYAGSFHVYGYGVPAPPAVVEALAGRGEGGTGAAAPITKRLHTEEDALRAALAASDQLTITVVAVPADPGGAVPERPFEHVTAVFEPPSA